ncbi:NAD(P)-dependent oxidoreductase [Kribbella sp. NBC_01484]|uniref:NAD-dependent epimerase/dehydratase family protein n=1 Tax=Kribbella sp. NBC_01484 TaxID=2903579 RepID=UPI002E32BFB6|nr:NAD(P)-dependent oxidoreductase [Kribbella sp. NBC_01484]
MRIFVAGATGVIGRRLVPQLVAQGHEVTALTRRDHAVAEGVRTVVGDVYDAAGLREVVAAARPEVVFHQLTDLSSQDFAANSRIRREGTRNLIDAALFAGVDRVISQSIAWAYEPGDAPAVESTPFDLNAADDRRRASVQAVAALEDITAEASEWVVLRYGMLYGPDTWYTKGGAMADLAATGNLPTGPDITSFLHVDDAASAAAAALHWPTGPVNIVDNTPAPASEWTPAFAESVGAPAPTTSAGPPGPATSADVPASPASPAPSGAAPARTPWARGASSIHARTNLDWTPAHPTWRSGFWS